MNKSTLISGIILMLIGIEILAQTWNDARISIPYLVITTIMFAVGIGAIIKGFSMKPEFKYGRIILGITFAVFVYLGADMFFHYPYRIIVQFGTIAIIIWILRKKKKKPDHLEMLKQRYAKGEITREDFEKIKEDLKD